MEKHDGLSVGKGGRRISQERTSGLYRLYDHRCRETKKELILTRKRGYAIDNMEHEFGVKCVAMPIFNQQHQVEAAISVSGPSLRFEEERIQKIAEKLKDTVRKIERRL